MPSIHFDITGSNQGAMDAISQVQGKYAEVVRTLEKMGVKQMSTLEQTKSGISNTEKAINKLKEGIKGNEDLIADMNKELDKLVAEADRLAKSGKNVGIWANQMKDVEQHAAEMQKLIDETNEYKSALEFLENPMARFEEKSDATAKSQSSLRRQMMQMTRLLGELTIQYRKMSDEEKSSAEGRALDDKIHQLTKDLGDLRDAMGDVNREVAAQANDTLAFSAISEGADVAISAVGGVVGVMGLMGAKEEEMMAIQTKVQSILSVSNALKTIQNNLQKESNLMVGIGVIQDKAKAASIALRTAAESKGVVTTKAATVAQAAFNAVANANPYVLLAGAILTVVGVLAAFTLGTKENKEEQEKLNRELELQKEIFDAQSKAVESVNKKYVEEKTKLDLLNKAVHSNTLSLKERQSALDELKKMVPDYHAALTQEGKLVRDNTSALTEHAKKLKETAQLQAKFATYMALLNEVEKLNAEDLRMSMETKALQAQANKLFAEGQGDTKAYEEVVEKLREINKESLVMEKNLESAKKAAESYYEKNLEALVKAASTSTEKTTPINTNNKNNKSSAEEIAAETAKIEKQAKHDVAEREKIIADLVAKTKEAEYQAEAEGDTKVKKLREQKHAEELRQLELQRKEALAKELERQEAYFNSQEELQKKKNPNYKKKVFGDADVNKEELEKIGKAYDDLIKAVTERQESEERKALHDQENILNQYLLMYGTFEEKMAAIHAKYEEQRQQTTNEAQKKIYDKQEEADKQALRFEELQKGLNWEELFNNLETVATSRLESIKKDMRDALMGGEFSPEDAKVISERIKAITDEINARGGIFDFGSQSRRAQKDNIASLKDRMDSTSDPVEKARLKKLYDEAKEDYDNRDIKIRAQELAESFAKVSEAANGLYGVIDTLGFGDTKFGKKAKLAVEGVSSAANAVGDFASGNYFGAAVNGIKSIVSFAKLIDGGNKEDMQRSIDRLTESNKALSAVMKDLQNSMKDANVGDAFNVYNRQEKVLKASEANMRNIMQNQSKMWETGSKSIGGILGKDKNFQELLRRASGITGTSLKSSSQLLNLSASQWKSLRDADPQLYADILNAYREAENKHTGSGIDKLIGEYINEYADAFDDLTKQLNEKLTGVSFDSVLSSFQSSLMDMNKDASSFSEDFSKYLMQAVLNAKVGELIKKDLEGWYDEFAEANKDGSLTEAEINALRTRYNDIVKRGLEIRDELADLTGYEETAMSSGKSRGFAAMSQDVGEELNGRFTAMQIAMEGIRTNIYVNTEQISNIVNNLTALANLGIDRNEMLSDIRGMMFNSTNYLEDIAKYAKEQYQYLVTKIDRITSNTDKL